MFDQVSIFFIVFGGFMSWTIALGLILENEKQTYHYMFAALMFCLGALQLLDGLFIVLQLSSYYFSWLVFWHLPFMAWMGPLFFLTFKSANNDSFRLKPVDYLHFACGILMVPLLIPLIAMEPAAKLSFITSTPDFTSGDALFRYYSGLLVSVILCLMGYMVYFIRECFFMLDVTLIREKKASPYLLIIILVSFPLEIIFFANMIVATVMDNPGGYYFRSIQALTLMSFFLTLSVFIMEKKNINFFRLLHTQIEERRYEISKIRNLDVANVVSKLKTLMEEKKIFFDEELSVNDLAREIAVEPYQLSQIINENFNKNFNSFVNEYRIEEAKKILLSEKDRTVISVAYAVGFNSTTVFYDWFNRLTGVSPKKFRAIHANE